MLNISVEGTFQERKRVTIDSEKAFEIIACKLMGANPDDLRNNKGIIQKYIPSGYEYRGSEGHWENRPALDAELLNAIKMVKKALKELSFKESQKQ